MQSPPGWQSYQQAQPPAYEAPPPREGGARTDLSAIEALKFPFQGDSWMSNLFIAFVFQMIPILGQIALLGWHAEIMHRLHRGDPQPVPKLDFSDMMHYFSKGVPAFLGGLVIGLPFGMLIGMVMGVGGVVVGAVAASMRVRGPEVIFAVYGLAGLVMLVMSPIMAIAGNAVTTRAEYTEDGGKALEFGKLWDYAGKTWMLSIVGWLGTSFFGSFVIFAGMLVCFIGIYPAVVAVTLARVHMRWQIYEVYLSRGGEPIPMKANRDLPPSEARRA